MLVYLAVCHAKDGSQKADLEAKIESAKQVEDTQAAQTKITTIRQEGAKAEADAVITQFARVNANVIAAMQKARAIVRYGIGVDNVDLDAARARGIPVCNVPDYCIDE